jgi:hypothetical protein
MSGPVRRFLASVVLAVSVAATPGAARAGDGAGGIDLLGLGFQLININSGKCLTVVGEAMGDNARIMQRTCSRQPAYRWRFVPVTIPGLFLIQNLNSGKCLAVEADGLADNDFAVQHSCATIPARQWHLQGLPVTSPIQLNSDAQLVNAHSDKCLTIAGGGVGENGVAVQYRCDGERSRRWTVRLMAGPILGERDGRPGTIASRSGGTDDQSQPAARPGSGWPFRRPEPAGRRGLRRASRALSARQPVPEPPPDRRAPPDGRGARSADVAVTGKRQVDKWWNT